MLYPNVICETNLFHTVALLCMFVGWQTGRNLNSTKYKWVYLVEFELLLWKWHFFFLCRNNLNFETSRITPFVRYTIRLISWLWICCGFFRTKTNPLPPLLHFFNQQIVWYPLISSSKRKMRCIHIIRDKRQAVQLWKCTFQMYTWRAMRMSQLHMQSKSSHSYAYDKRSTRNTHRTEFIAVFITMN